MNRRTFNREFKLDICRQITGGEKRLAQICREHGIGASVVERWCDQYKQKGDNSFPGSMDSHEQGQAAAESRIAALEASLGRAHLEIDFLRGVLEKKGSAPRRSSS